MVSERLVQTFSGLTTLSSEEKTALRSLSSVTKRIKADDIVVRQGSRHGSMFLILSGVAIRYKYLISGKRQIFGYLLPGDLCEAHFLVSNAIDHEIAAASDVTAALIPTHELVACAATFPNIRRALVKSMEADCALLREYVINVGQRNALERLAHFLCELWRRLQVSGETDGSEQLRIPLSQLDIADTMGLTVAHVSRCMQQLRRANLIVWSRRALIVLDLERLQRVADECDATACAESPPLAHLQVGLG